MPVIWLVFGKSVEIHVPALAEQVLNVALSTTPRYVHVPMDTPAILSATVTHHVCFCNFVRHEEYFVILAPKPIADDPCGLASCGPNTQCNNGICTCLAEYQGDPYRGCRPECVLSSDCPRDKTCIRNKCKDPCPGTCGQNAECSVLNHIPTCTCIQGYIGNAFILCSPIPGNYIPFEGKPNRNQTIPEEVKKNPCNPSPCGPNSQCREINGQAVCSCVPGFIGSPPTCRPECVTSTECSLNQACVNQKCIDPCPGTCGLNAKCQVVNHNPICSCPPKYSGDPFIRCLPIRKILILKSPVGI